MRIKIETSARHCHLSLKDLGVLFGKGYQLRPLKPISQPGQFAAKETINLEVSGNRIDNLRILGPVRGTTQIEITQTDAHRLNIHPPIRQSGDLKGSAGAKLIGPKGMIRIKEGVIIAERHIHCDPASAKKLGLKNNQLVSVKTRGNRSVVFNNILVRINTNFSLAFHIDTDEANATLDFNREQKVEYGLLIIKPR